MIGKFLYEQENLEFQNVLTDDNTSENGNGEVAAVGKPRDEK